MAQLTSRAQQGCSTSQRTSLAGRGARSCVRSTTVRCFKSNVNDNGVKRANLQLRFKIPYRVNFGQSLGLVGSGDALGNWDPKRTVRMKWTDGDWWTVELNMSPGGSLDLEYKYVVVNPDGSVGYWKPGNNYRVTVPLLSGENKVASCIKVADAWDESFKNVDVEEAETPPKTASNSFFNSNNGGSPSANNAATLKGQTQEFLPQQPLATAAVAAASSTQLPQPTVNGFVQSSSYGAASNGTGPVSATSETGGQGTAAEASAPQESGSHGASVAPQTSASPVEEKSTSASQASATTTGRAHSPRSPPPTFAAATTIPVIHPSLLVEQERLEDGVRNSLEDLQAQMDKHQQLRDRNDEVKLAAAEATTDVLAGLKQEVAFLRHQLAVVQRLLVSACELLSALLRRSLMPGGQSLTHQAFVATERPLTVHLDQASIKPLLDPRYVASATAWLDGGLQAVEDVTVRHALLALQKLMCSHEPDRPILDTADPFQGSSITVEVDAVSKEPLSPLRAPPEPSVGRKVYVARSAALGDKTQVRRVKAIGRGQALCTSQTIVPIVCGVGRGSLGGARGQFDVGVFREAQHAKAKLPACIELQAVKQQEAWIDVVPSRRVTPLDFVQESGLRGKNWKSSIRMAQDGAVGKSIGEFLQQIIGQES